ncbi:MAG TPA: HAMP domain-containing sensor histidine kinase [Flavisolibacter sp.]|nr:HAMP domain-containing sensor histidine kinase [Flavisolibacter sp.]
MKKLDRTLIYKIIAGVSFVVLCFTQLLHIRSMYNVESRNYNLDEKKTIQAEYEKSITNDKLFPGGSSIIDKILYRHIDTLEQMAQTKPELYHQYAVRIYDSIFQALHQANNMDSLLSLIKKRNNIQTDLQYALAIRQIDLAFDPNRYIPFFSAGEKPRFTSVPYVENVGARIGGNLKHPSADNQTSGFIVSSPLERSYRISFALYTDSPHRLKQIMLNMLPTILVSVFSIFTVLAILLATLINWQKQKKIAEAKSDFINTITHEFQTPLSAIIIANKTIENENLGLGSEKLSFLTGIIRRQTERLDILTKQVTGASTDQGLALTTCTYEVNTLLDEMLQDYGFNLQGKKTRISFTRNAAADTVLLDKVHFTTIITNLLDNAVKYNRKPQREIHITSFNPNEKTLALSIRDNGNGMSDKVKKNMFTRFYRDPSLTRSNEPGLGLGLYFVRQSLEGHNWKYEVKTKEGAGTEFLIYMPLYGNNQN